MAKTSTRKKNGYKLKEKMRFKFEITKKKFKTLQGKTIQREWLKLPNKFKILQENNTERVAMWSSIS